MINQYNRCIHALEGILLAYDRLYPGKPFDYKDIEYTGYTWYLKKIKKIRKQTYNELIKELSNELYNDLLVKESIDTIV